MNQTGETPNRTRRLLRLPLGQASLQRQIILLVITMVVIVIAASGAGLAFSAFVGRSFIQTRQASAQVEAIHQTRQDWNAVAATIDRILIYRQPFFLTEDAAKLLATFEDDLARLQPYQPAGAGAAELAAARAQLEFTRTTGASLIDVTRDILLLAEGREWERALSRWQVEYALLQRRMDESLANLNAEAQTELARQQTNTQTLQRSTSLYLAAALAVAVILALWMGYITLHSITRPVKQLTDQTRRVMSGDFSPLTPLTRRDELGDLSRAFGQMTDWLRESYEQMEQRVALRTQDLQRRTEQVRTAAEVASELARIPNTALADDGAPAGSAALLQNSAELIRSRFHLAQATIFLQDPERRTLSVGGQAGDPSARPSRLDQTLPLTAVTQVNQAISSGTALVWEPESSSSSHTAAWMAALPLKTGQQTSGVLLVQARPGQAIEPEMVNILQIVGDQLAAALQNQRLLEEVRNRLSELESLYATYSQSAWGKSQSLAGGQIQGYAYDHAATRPLAAAEAAAETAAPAGQPVEFPLEVRGVSIGVLEAWPSEDRLGLTAEQTAILTDLSSRLGQAMENARLFTEAQGRALREQALNQFSARLVQSLDIESLLRAAVDELGQLAPVTEASIHIGLAAEPPSPGNGKHPSRSAADGDEYA